MSFKRHLAAGIALMVGLVALTGSAHAAPPSTPPGQEKQAEKQAEQAPTPAAAAPVATTAPATQSAPAENKGQDQKAAKAENPSGINSTTAGVKPSNDTQKNTKCWTGGSTSSPTCQPGTNADSSKRYGNGKTAAQIAASRGAPAGTEIRGPGNSQPHKVCGKNGKFVDVHAVKSYVGISCSSTATTHSTTPHSQSASTHTSSTSTSHTRSTHVTSSTSQPGATSGTAAAGGIAGTVAAGGVAGVAVESGSAQSGSAQSGSNGAAGGVLGAFGVAGVAAGGVLPFTGFPLWLAILAAIALIAIGWTFHSLGRQATRDLV